MAYTTAHLCLQLTALLCGSRCRCRMPLCCRQIARGSVSLRSRQVEARQPGRRRGCVGLWRSADAAAQVQRDLDGGPLLPGQLLQSLCRRQGIQHLEPQLQARLQRAQHHALQALVKRP
jgi:hypothetical protein